MSRVESVVIAALFYAGWFGSVFLARTRFPWVALVFPLVLVGFLVLKKRLNQKAFAAAGLIALVGVLFDSFLADSRFVSVRGQTGWLIPVWLMAIWLLFSYSMIKIGVVFHPPVWLASLLGFVLGPLSYKSGEIFEVLHFSTPQTFLIYAVFWAFVFPLILRVSKELA